MIFSNVLSDVLYRNNVSDARPPKKKNQTAERDLNEEEKRIGKVVFPGFSSDCRAERGLREVFCDRE